MDKELIIVILELIAKYGITGVISILKVFQKDTVTKEDIEALKDLVKDPESYIPVEEEV